MQMKLRHQMNMSGTPGLRTEMSTCCQLYIVSSVQSFCGALRLTYARESIQIREVAGGRGAGNKHGAVSLYPRPLNRAQSAGCPSWGLVGTTEELSVRTRLEPLGDTSVA